MEPASQEDRMKGLSSARQSFDGVDESGSEISYEEAVERNIVERKSHNNVGIDRTKIPHEDVQHVFPDEEPLDNSKANGESQLLTFKNFIKQMESSESESSLSKQMAVETENRNDKNVQVQHNSKQSQQLDSNYLFSKYLKQVDGEDVPTSEIGDTHVEKYNFPDEDIHEESMYVNLDSVNHISKNQDNSLNDRPSIKEGDSLSLMSSVISKSAQDLSIVHSNSVGSYEGSICVNLESVNGILKNHDNKFPCVLEGDSLSLVSSVISKSALDLPIVHSNSEGNDSLLTEDQPLEFYPNDSRNGGVKSHFEFEVKVSSEAGIKTKVNRDAEKSNVERIGSKLNDVLVPVSSKFEYQIPNRKISNNVNHIENDVFVRDDKIQYGIHNQERDSIGEEVSQSSSMKEFTEVSSNDSNYLIGEKENSINQLAATIKLMEELKMLNKVRENRYSKFPSKVQFVTEEYRDNHSSTGNHQSLESSESDDQISEKIAKLIFTSEADRLVDTSCESEVVSTSYNDDIGKVDHDSCGIDSRKCSKNVPCIDVSIDTKDVHENSLASMKQDDTDIIYQTLEHDPTSSEIISVDAFTNERQWIANSKQHNKENKGIKLEEGMLKKWEDLSFNFKSYRDNWAQSLHENKFCETHNFKMI